MRTVWLVFRNDMRRRLRDRSVLMTAFVAPLALSLVLGVAFHGNRGALKMGIWAPSGASGDAAIARVREVAGSGVQFTVLSSSARVHAEVAAGTVDAGVVVDAAGTPSVVARSGQPVGGAVAAALQAELQGDRSGTAVITVKDQTVAGRQGLIGYFAPSMGVLFLFFVASVGARGFLEERASGTLARLRASPVTPRSLVGGKVAAMLGMGLVSLLVLWVITVHLFGSTWGAPLPVFLACVASALAMTGIGSLVTVFSTNQQQAIGVSGIVGFLLGLLGGNFFPPGALPPLLVTLSRVTPNRWALETFGTLALDHGTLRDVWPGLVVLTVMAAVTGLFAMTQVRRTVTV